MLNGFCNSNGSTVYCEKEQTLNSGECSELAGTLTSPTNMLEDKRLAADVPAIGIVQAERTTNMILFNNGYVVTIMDTSTTQLIIQQPAVSSVDPVWPVSDTTIACQDNSIISTSTDIHSVVLSPTKIVKHSIYHYFSSTFEVNYSL